MGALDPMRQASAEALGDLAIGIDAGEIDGPVWSVSDRGTGAFRSSRADSGAQVLPPASVSDRGTGAFSCRPSRPIRSRALTLNRLRR
jgi:hypothetical protein